MNTGTAINAVLSEILWSVSKEDSSAHYRILCPSSIGPMSDLAIFLATPLILPLSPPWDPDNES